MKKSLLTSLFIIFHLASSFWGTYLVGSYWFDFLPHYSVALVSILIFLPVSCVYLILMRKDIIGTVPTIICFAGNLLLYGLYAFAVLIFRSFRSYFELSLFAISHDLVLIALFVQCFVVFPSLRHQRKKKHPIKEFKSAPCVVARTQRIHNSVWYTLFKKHYCPSCSAKLELITKTKLIVSNAPGANNHNGILSEVSPEENIRFIWKEFQCPMCKTEFTIENMRKIEHNKQ